MTTSPSDHALLDRFLRDGDDVALGTLVDRVAPTLFRLARALTAWRVIGAQTVAERAWRAALARAGEVNGDAALWRVLLDEVVRCASAAGDSPRTRHADEPPARAAAMRAVTLLPSPARAVYALHEIGGADVAAIADILALPEVRVRAELWHARLTVETLVGGEPSPDGTIWQEPVPPELAERLREGARHRRAIGGRHGRYPRSVPKSG